MSLRALLPILAFVAVAAVFAYGIIRGDLEDRSALAGQLAPPVEAVPLGSLPSFDGSVFADGEVKIVNFWASWCAPCRLEHGDLLQLSQEGIPVYGVNRADNEADALAFLAELGNPFEAVVFDPLSRQSLEWGVVAPPETFILDGEGRIIRRFAGPISGVMETIIRPELARAGLE